METTEPSPSTDSGRYVPCIGCGEVIQIPLTPIGGESPNPRCAECRQHQDKVTRNTERSASYDRAAWRKLSRELRRTAACSVCGTRQDLTLDHLNEEAWRRHGLGLPLRPGTDVDVKCRSHNASAGAARGPYAERG